MYFLSFATREEDSSPVCYAMEVIWGIENFPLQSLNVVRNVLRIYDSLQNLESIGYRYYNLFYSVAFYILYFYSK